MTLNGSADTTDLMEVLQSGSEERCLEYFRGMAEKARRQLAPSCLQWHRQVTRNEFAESNSQTHRRIEWISNAEIGVLATASFSELQKLPLHALPGGKVAFRILDDRRPTWIPSWAERLLNDETYWWHWGLVRNLVTAGLLERPEHPHYVLGMISGIASRRRGEDWNVTIEQCLARDPGLLEEEVWRLFEFEGGGLNSLANWDRFESQRTWHEALMSFMRQGVLPRDRLLTCSLDALERDFNHYRAKWFFTFHDALDPSQDEQEAFAERYLGLLGATAPNVVTWALKRIEKLAKSDRLPTTDLLLSSLPPVLEARQKGTVTKGLKLLDHVARTNDAHRRGAILSATVALGHEAPDVQQAAFDLLDKWGSRSDEELASRMLEYSDYIAPSLRERFKPWQLAAGTSSVSQSDAGAMPAKSEAEPPSLLALQPDELDPETCHLFAIDTLRENLARERLEIPAIRHDGVNIPRLRGREKLSPIADLDELIDVCARVVEDGSLVDEAERALDGLSRLCDARPANFDSRVGPLRKRVIQLLKRGAAPFGGFGPRDDLCGVIHAWTTGQLIRGERVSERHYLRYRYMVEGEERVMVGDHLEKAIAFLSRRSLAIAERVATGCPAPLLSAPTHAGGWIAAEELVRRVRNWRETEPHVTDICLAMLRLAPDGRAEALHQLDEDPPSTRAEWREAIRHALGAPKAKIGKKAAYWLAAARARAPWSDDQRVMKAFPNHGPDAGEAARYEFGTLVNPHGQLELYVTTQPTLPEVVAPDWVAVLFHAQYSVATRANYYLRGTAARNVDSLRWTATIWPQARESYSALAALDLADNLDWWEARWENKTLLEPLLDSGTPLRPISLFLLAIALAAKEPGESGLATDIAIQAIHEGRLVPDNFGPTLATLLPTGQIKPGRWHKTLSEIARHSPLHALIIQQSLQHGLHGTPTSLPRDYAKLLELLKELSFALQQPIVHDECRTFLAQINPSGKAGKIAQELLAIPPAEFSSSGRALLVEALAQRIAAVERGR